MVGLLLGSCDGEKNADLFDCTLQSTLKFTEELIKMTNICSLLKLTELTLNI